MQTNPNVTLDSLNALLKSVKQKHPEQADMVDAFSPLARTHVALGLEWAALPLRPRAPYTRQTLPVDTGEALAVGGKLAAAIAEGFPESGPAVQTFYAALSRRPSPVKKLCLAALDGDTVPLQDFAAKLELADSVGWLHLLLLQMGRALAAKTSLRVQPKTPGCDDAARRCPCCGEQADMSILYQTEGIRLLHCSLCGHIWRFSRTACPYCGLDKAKNIDMLFEQGHQVERAEHCAACNTYLLGVDARALNIAPELAYYVTLGMGHLDALMQESGAVTANA